MKHRRRRVLKKDLQKGIFSVIGMATLVALLIVSGVQTARAAVFIVNSTADTVDISPGDGICADSFGNCSLRAAIIEANALAGADVITLPVGTYLISIPGIGENAAATGDLDITGDLTINGAGAAAAIIDGASLDRVLDVLPGATVQINAVTVRNGNPSGNAGGIFNQGTLTLNRNTVTNNTGLNFGGGIVNFGTMTLTNSTVRNNSTVGSNLTGGGGGIFNQGTMILTGSTFNGNTTFGRGGAIYNLDLSLTLANSTISGNTGLNGGGIFSRFGTVSLTQVTNSGNTATDNGGGLWNFGGTMTLANTIVSGNAAATSSNDCAGAKTSLGYNLAGGASCAFAGTGDLNSTNPLLGPLTNNSGPTETQALLVGSPAIDVVPLLACTVSTDQRGVPRPMGPACDIGAFERVVPDACNNMTFDTIIVGTAGNNTLNGGNGRDLIFGLGGNDTLNGSNNNDCLVGGDGNDHLNGSNGNDFLDGGTGNDTLTASNGDDTLNGGANADTLNGGNGNDVIEGGADIDTLNGSNGNDYIDGGDGNDKLNGNNGDDTLIGGADIDTLNGGLGFDSCDGETELLCEI